MQTYYPLANSPILTPQQWSKMAQNWLNTGVIKGQLNQLQVYADSTGMQVKVKSGQAYIKGHFYESDAEEILPISAADAINPRIDRIILNINWTFNTMQLAVLQGVAAVGSPTPVLTQNSSRWEIPLAQIYVAPGVATLAAGSVTDERKFVKNANDEQSPWMPLTLVNGWVNVGTVYDTAQYRLNSFGEVELKGLIKSGTTTTGTIIATLPVGYRPPLTRSYLITAISATIDTGRIFIKSNGDIVIQSGGNLTLSFDDVPPIATA
jgi:hypothetical protein